MRLTEPLLRLPLNFDAGLLAKEVSALPVEAWVPHPNKLPGNEAVRLVTPEGQMTEGVAGNMAPTKYLLNCPYMMDVMAEIGAVWGRGRLMRLAPASVVPAHIDTNYYWRKHVRVHIPITTTPDVLFTCGGETVHMAAGECWIFDTFSVHYVRNGGTRSRTHLVIDTVGGEQLWDLVDAARSHNADIAPAQHTRPGAARRDLMFEREAAETLMSPWELQCHVAFIADQTEADPMLATVMKQMDRFVSSWKGIWAQYGASAEGVPAYQRLISNLELDLLKMGGEKLTLRNKLPLYRQIAELLFTVTSSLPASARTDAPSSIGPAPPAGRSYAS